MSGGVAAVDSFRSPRRFAARDATTIPVIVPGPPAQPNRSAPERPRRRASSPTPNRSRRPSLGSTIRRCKQKHIARLHRMRSFQIDLDGGIWTERAGNDVFGDIARDFAARPLSRRLQFPDEAVIKRQLFDAGTRRAIGEAVGRRGPSTRRRAIAPTRWRWCPCRENPGWPRPGV